MYTTPCDAGMTYSGSCTGSRSSHAWGDYTYYYGYTSQTTGEANTNGLGTRAEAVAAKTCYDLVTNGQSDWYLPARDELIVLMTNRDAIGGFLNQYYWTSSEYNTDGARVISIYDQMESQHNKSWGNYYRCVRKD